MSYKILKTTVAKEGFYGIYHEAKQSIDKKKVVIVLGGSEGNENIPMEVGKMFADRGISAMGVCYWNVEGLPDSIIEVPLEPFEKAVSWLQRNGYEKIYIYGISKGAELALLCASLIPDISGVIALSPSHCIWSGIQGNGSLFSKTFSRKSEFTWRGKDLPYMVAKVKYGKFFFNLLREQQINMRYLYEEPLMNFEEETAIQVENIKGDILLIYSENDTMWPSKESVDYITKRLKERQFAHSVQTIGYDKASHILVPLNPSTLKMYQIERKYPKECRTNRMDAFDKTIEWISNRI